MKYHCDALLPRDERIWSPAYKRSAGSPVLPLDPELLAFMATPGFLPMHFSALFGWYKPVRVWREVVGGALDPYRGVGVVNASTVTVEDGLALMDRLAGAWGPLPYWCSKAVGNLAEREIRERWGLSRHAAKRVLSGAGWGLGGVWTGQKYGWDQIGVFSGSRKVV